MKENLVHSKKMVNYIKSENGLQRVMTLILDKYILVGDTKGVIHLENSSQCECEILGFLTKKHYTKGETIKLSVSRFFSILKSFDMEHATAKLVLKIYFESLPETNVEKRRLKTSKKNALTTYVDVIINHIGIKTWYKAMENDKSSGSYKWLMRSHNESEEGLKNTLSNLKTILIYLSNNNQVIPIPTVAAKCIGDSHGLDHNRQLRRCLSYYLIYTFNNELNYTRRSEIDAFNEANILIDYGFSNVATYGLIAFDHSGESLGWETFNIRREQLILNSNNLKSVAKIKASGAVYCFENPAMLHHFIECFPEGTCICSSGEPNAVVKHLIGLLERDDIKVYYHGDYDPKGFDIADRMLSNFSSMELLPGTYTMDVLDAEYKFKLFDFEEVDYGKSYSNGTINKISKELVKKNRVYYEEAIVDLVLKNIK